MYPRETGSLRLPVSERMILSICLCQGEPTWRWRAGEARALCKAGICVFISLHFPIMQPRRPEGSPETKITISVSIARLCESRSAHSEPTLIRKAFLNCKRARQRHALVCNSLAKIFANQRYICGRLFSTQRCAFSVKGSRPSLQKAFRAVTCIILFNWQF